MYKQLDIERVVEEPVFLSMNGRGDYRRAAV